MTMQVQGNGRKRMRRIGVAGLAVLLSSGVLAHASPQEITTKGKEKQVLTQNKFYCNIKALNPAERIRHKQLTDKLVAGSKSIIEREKGYEFQYTPPDVSLLELANWVLAESKCCPFFDFHIDLEREGKLVCLRLTGDEGIKAFIRSEFHLPSK